MTAIAYRLLTHTLVKQHGKGSFISRVLGYDLKGRISILLYAIGISIAFIYSWLSMTIYMIVAILWFYPDRRIENNTESESESESVIK